MNKNKPIPVRFYRYGYEYVRLPKSILAGAKIEMVIDPNIHWGEPTIRGTRLPLESMAIYGKRDGIDKTTKNFDVSEDAVREAIAYMDAMPIATNKEKE